MLIIMTATMTVAQILAGAQPTTAAEAARLSTVHGTRLHALESKLEAHRRRSQYLPAAQVRRLVAEIGDVQIALSLLATWASVLA